MNCPKCGDIIKEKKNFCPNCATPINGTVQQEINITDGGVGIGVGSGNKVHIGVIEKIETHVNSGTLEKIPCTYTVKGKGIKYDNLKTFSTFAMIIGVVSSVITIAGVFVDFKIFNLGIANKILPWAMILGGVGAYIFFVCKELSKPHGFAWLRPFKIVSLSVKKLVDGRVVRIKIDAKCDVCGGKIKFFKNYDTGKVTGYCENNSEHRFEFDHTSFTAKRIQK